MVGENMCGMVGRENGGGNGNEEGEGMVGEEVGMREGEGIVGEGARIVGGE